MKICLIKLGAEGDVVRTLPLAKAIKKKYPFCNLTWITKQGISPLLEGNPYIDKIIFPKGVIPSKFDIVYNLDIDKEASDIALKINSPEKYGFYLEDDFPVAFNPSAEYYINSIFDDDLKRENKKTYQEMMFEVAETPYVKEISTINLTSEDRGYANNFIIENKIPSENIIGIHIGSSSRWPSKRWHKENLKDFIRISTKNMYNVILFGGPNEIDYMPEIKNELASENIPVYFNNPQNTKREFAALIDKCDYVISGDSLALHIALALNKKTIGLFFCTSFNEVEDYGLLKKMVSPRFYEFFPERMDEYDEDLVKSISAEEVFENIKSFNKVFVVNAIIRNSEGKFLLIKRANEGIHAGKWALPGGMVELNEFYENALKREIKEEVNLNLKKILKKVADYEYPRPDGRITVGTSFSIEVENYEIKPNKEVSDFRWVSLEELAELDVIKDLEEELMNCLC